MYLRLTAWLLAGGLLLGLLFYRGTTEGNHTSTKPKPFRVSAVRLSSATDTGTAATLTLEGEGLTPPPRAWLVPATVPRQAIVASLETWGNPHEIIFAPPFAYIANGEAGIQTIDISNPLEPKILASLDTDGQALYATKAGDYLYVADGGAGLAVYNVATPSHPLLITQLRTPGPALTLAIAKQILYIACGSAGIAVVDINTPAAPRLTKLIPTSATARNLTLHKQTLLASQRDKQFTILEVAADGEPQKIRTVATEGKVLCLAWYGEIALVGEELTPGTYTLSLYDPLRKPAIRLSSLPLPAAAHTFTIDGTNLVIAYGEAGFDILDLSAPLRPRRIITNQLITRIKSGTIVQSKLWLAKTTGQLLCLDLATLQRLSQHNYHYLSSTTNSKNTDITDHHVLLQDRPKSISLFARQGYAPLIFQSRIDLPQDPRDTTWQQDRLIILTADSMTSELGDSSSLQVYDTSDPATPRQLSNLTFSGFPTAMTSDKDQMFIAFKHRIPSAHAKEPPWISGIDLSKPTAPQIVSTLNLTTDAPTALALRSDLLYIYSEADFRIFDVSRLTSPSLLGHLATPWVLRRYANFANVSLQLIGDVAYLTTPFGGLTLLDIHNPAAPKILQTLYEDEVILGTAVEHDLLFLATRNNGLLVFAVDKPRRPRLVGSLSPLLQPIQPKASDNWLSPRPNVLLPSPHALMARENNPTQLELDLNDIDLSRYDSLWIERDGQRQEIALPLPDADCMPGRGDA